MTALESAAKLQRLPFLLENLAEFSGISIEPIAVVYVEAQWRNGGHRRRIRPSEDLLGDGFVVETLFVFQMAAKQERMDPWGPFMMKTSKDNRRLKFIEGEIRSDTRPPIIVLKIITGVVILIFCQEKERV